MFLLPFIYYAVFHYIPMYGLTLGFKDYNIKGGIHGSEWVGVKHFQRYFADRFFWRVVKNTVLLNLLSLVFAFPAPIVLALLLNEVKSARFKKLAQSFTYLPHFISTVVVCGMIINFVSVDGVINQIIKFFGGKPKAFIIDPAWFRPIYIISGIWQEAGWGSIIYISALSAINTELYEAARVDGANRWRQMLNVTLPGISPTIVIMLIMQLGKIMEVGFEKVFLLYNGTTYETADVISTYVYRIGIGQANFSYATAINLFSAVIGLVFIVGANALGRNVSETSLW